MENLGLKKIRIKMIPGILELSSKIKYGLSSKNIPKYLFRPLDTSLGMCIVGSSEKNLNSNVLALVDVKTWEQTKLSNGNLVKIIGKCGEIQSELIALEHRYGHREWKNFNKETLIDPGFSEHPLIEGFSFNIDPEGCIDIDDIIVFGNDGYIYIVIADVACWVSKNIEIFIRASKIGQTLYSDTGKIVSSMLPIEQNCSFIPGNIKRGFALKFKWENNEITEKSFTKVSVINSCSFTYDNFMKSKYAETLQKLVSCIAKREVTDSHEWIEQLMMVYNIEAAKILREKRKGILRGQHSPDTEKLNMFSSFGVGIDFLANKSARYIDANEDDIVHWGINDIYCHATSPIRRFVDIINQSVLRGDEIQFWDSKTIETLNKKSKDAKKFQRDVFFMKKILESPERKIEGIILNDHRIWIPEWKRIITCRNEQIAGSKCAVYYSLDMNQPTWKRRMVFRV